jgi:protocatechuate 4,5-dioxygenase alpha chain
MAFDPKLPANRMIYEVRKSRALFTDFAARLEEVMARYELSEAERQAFRQQDIKGLRDLGVHPYFLPQVTRLLNGSRKNDSQSQAAQVYRRMMVERD